ncbi:TRANSCRIPTION FACTOR IBH1-LIKE 1 [Salix koriyanagi]|uniref:TRANSCRIPTION FACTOR IBH1-LIKE 1 n=1 Tax=Salix koriyanagi TaxID=2511006 RepID=A0A9Q1A650_9ROSI|nr:TRANSCRIPTION FACTOR IBH1-LIKE 1 [Salix koriyanagi]
MSKFGPCLQKVSIRFFVYNLMCFTSCSLLQLLLFLSLDLSLSSYLQLSDSQILPSAISFSFSPRSCMEEQMIISAKRRRVYPLEPDLVGQTMFVRNYVNHLVPALTKIRTCRPSDDSYGRDSEVDRSVRYEVDMAMAMSTPGFAWSRALKSRLNKNTSADGRFHDPSIHRHASLKPLSMHGPGILKRDADHHCSPNVTSQKKVAPNPNGMANMNRKSKRSRTKKEAAKQTEEEEFGSRLASLRSLMPGGNEMGVDELFSDMGSYITSLEMQVNILRCLVDSQN